MKKMGFWLVVIGIIGFFTKPEEKAMYEKVLDKEFQMGLNFLPNVKMKAVQSLYDYHDYVVCSVLKDHKSGEVTYLGVFTKIFLIGEEKERKEVDLEL
jgi:hypothetical protein